MFDTCWMVTRALGLKVTVKENGTKTAWSGTYWEDGVEKKIEGWEMRLPNDEVIPQVDIYKYLGGPERSMWADRHGPVR